MYKLIYKIWYWNYKLCTCLKTKSRGRNPFGLIAPQCFDIKQISSRSETQIKYAYTHIYIGIIRDIVNSILKYM